MDFQPVRDFIVVSKEEQAKQTSGGIFIPTTVEAQDKIATGVVTAVGSGVMTTTGTLYPLEVKVGDRIAFVRSLSVEIK